MICDGRDVVGPSCDRVLCASVRLAHPRRPACHDEPVTKRRGSESRVDRKGIGGALRNLLKARNISGRSGL